MNIAWSKWQQMVKRTIAAATLLSILQFNVLPVHAAPLPPSAPEAAAVEPQHDKTEETTTPAGQALKTEAAAPEKAKESAPSGSIDKLDTDYLKGILTDTGKIVSSPLHWESSDWLKAGAVLGGTGALFLVDRKIRDFTQSNQSSVASGFAKVGNSIGDPLYMFPSVGAFYLYGQLADDSRARRASLLALESLTISGALTTGLKSLGGRHRPKTGDLPLAWDGPRFLGKNVSFSSGHSSNAFSVATVIAEEYKDKPFVPPIAYGLATLTALSRVYSNEHWSSDVFFGAALGHLVSKAVLSYHKDDKLSSRLTLIPQVGKEMKGVTMSYKF